MHFELRVIRQNFTVIIFYIYCSMLDDNYVISPHMVDRNMLVCAVAMMYVYFLCCYCLN